MIKNKQKIRTLLRDFLEDRLVLEGWYQDIKPHLKAVILYGSVAKGTNREDSEIDILFILPLETEDKYTEGEYFFNYKNEVVSVVIRSIERLKIIAEGKHDAFQAEVFRQSEIIWQKDDETINLLNKIKRK